LERGSKLGIFTDQRLVDSQNNNVGKKSLGGEKLKDTNLRNKDRKICKKRRRETVGREKPEIDWGFLRPDCAINEQQELGGRRIEGVSGPL